MSNEQQECPMETEACCSFNSEADSPPLAPVSTPPQQLGSPDLHPALSTPLGLRCRLRHPPLPLAADAPIATAAASAGIILSTPSPMTTPLDVHSNTGASSTSVIGGGAGDGSVNGAASNDLSVVQEQATQFFRILAQERQTLSRRLHRFNPASGLRTAPAKMLQTLGGYSMQQQQQQQQSKLRGSLAVNRILTFDEDDEQMLADNNNKKIVVGRDENDATALMPPPPPRPHHQQHQQLLLHQSASDQLLQTLRKSQLRMYKQSGMLSRLSGSNINRCTPDGRRRLSCGNSNSTTSSSASGGGGGSGDSGWGRVVDERLLNSDRLCKEFDLTDTANTRQLASGSFGYVFSAINRLDGRVYCIKTAQTNKHRDAPTAAAQAREGIQELWAMASLSEHHPNIVSYYGCWVQFDRLYIQLEYCNGLCLGSYLAADNHHQHHQHHQQHQLLHLPAHRQQQLAAEIGSALEFMHSEGLAHLDCSTSNILLKAPGANLPPSLAPSARRACLSKLASNKLNRLVFKLGDFGHARDWRDTDNLEDGAGRFMPMDALDLQRHPDARLVDNYSLGLCLIESAGRRIPASTDSVEDGAERLRLLEVGLIDRPVEMPEQLYSLVLRLIKPDPLQRLSLDCLLRSLSEAM